MRKGWALAQARPWNDQTTVTAALRLDRGSDRFLRACGDWLFDRGVSTIRSPALALGQTPVWKRAGFGSHLELDIYERDLRREVADSVVEVIEVQDPDPAQLASIDDEAFDETWRVGRLGLSDARQATARSVVLAVLSDDAPVGFSIVGETSRVGYLQRLAVRPSVQGRGVGRSLVRESIRWARRSGARTMLLNTQPDNQTSAALYRSEGFLRLPHRLQVLARTPNSETPS
ncbi:MAG: GNAT family N-acetyltransferase [Acidimicrobiia bacterium]